MTTHIHIDRLVLRGIDPANRQALAAGLQAELARTLSQTLADPAHASFQQSRRTPVLRLGQMPIEQGTAGARKFGANLARAIGKGITP